MAVRDYFRQFCLMSWKNCKLQLGNPLQLVFILLCPPLFICVAVMMRINISMKIRTDKFYEAIDLNRSWLEMVEKLERARKVAESYNIEHNPWTPHLVIGWAPQEYNLFEQLIANAQTHFEPMKLTSFKDCGELRKRMVKDSMFAGICLDDKKFDKKLALDGSDVEIKPHINYSIIMPSELRQLDGDFRRGNWYTLYTSDPNTAILNRLNQVYEGAFVSYVREGFILIQKAITESFLKLVSEKELPNIVLRRFPVLGSREDPLMYELDSGLPILILIGYLFPSLIFIWQIVREKQTLMRQFLVNMNISNLIQFFSWFLTCLVCFVISSFVIVVLLKVPWNLNDAVLTQTDWYVVLMVIVSYCFVVASYVVMVASIFSDPHSAVRVATIIWVAFYMPNFVLWNNMTKAVWTFRYVSYLVPNVVLSSICKCLVDRETIVQSKFDVFTYSNTYRSCPLSELNGFWIFMVNCFIYCGIGIYMDIRHMGERSTKRINREEARANIIPEDQYQDWAENITNQVRSIDVNSTKIYEVEPSNRRFKLKIKKLCKRFGAKDRPTLNYFTWNVYEQEVTVLMGHNGCGKSTLLKILAGLMEPSRGSVTVANYDMLTEKKAACMELGLALGTKMLITGLTVLEHLRFICRVKGMSNKMEIDGHVSYYMHALQIDELKDKRLNKLMPRELVLVSICCAFVGNSSIILIDDIYSNLDSPTVSLIWAIINEEKSYRTIIVVVNTTTLAESISDRLAIMSNGELKCTGTKPFLKNMYGHGFRLICIKGKDCKIEELIALMNRHLPNLTIESNFGLEVIFILENKDEDKFPGLIDDLEKNMKLLDVASFRIRDTSTMEIFLRFGCDEDAGPNDLIDKYFATLADVEPNKRRSGYRLWLLHLRALFYKRNTIYLKNYLIILLEMLTFILAVLCTLSGAFIYGKHFDLIPLTYNISQLYDIKVFAELASDEEDLKDMLEYYKESLYWYDAKVETLGKTQDGSYILTRSNEFSHTVNMAFLFGATFDKNLVTAWFNNIPLHIAPITLNLVYNAVAKNFLDQDAIIDVTLEPLPFQSNINIFPPGSQAFGTTLASAMSFVLCFITPAHYITVFREESGNLKKQHFLAGARQFSFWAFTILYDIFYQCIFNLILTLLVACYIHPDHDLAFYIMLFVAIMMSGILMCLVTYLIASRCRNPVVGFILVSLISCAGFLVFAESHRVDFGDLPRWLSLFYQYVSAVLILKLCINYENRMFCSDPLVKFTSSKVYKCAANPNCCIHEEYTNEANGIITDFLLLAGWIVLISVLLYISHFYNLVGFSNFRAASKNTTQSTNNPDRPSDSSSVRGQISDDPSAVIERQKVSNLSPEERSRKALVVEGLVSQYGKLKVLKGLNLTLAKGECLNVTGLNNSGRSTLLKIIVREAKLKRGEMWIHGHSVQRQRGKTYRMVGYCPQYDYLPPEFTPRQLLYMQALLHGHPKGDAHEVTDALIRMLGLYQCSNRSASVCTPAEESKLFFAFSILSSPELVCVDGVPAGLDPIGQRICLTVTSIMQSMGSTFLYTSLPAMFTERVCNRLCVLFDGELWMIRSMDNESKPYWTGYQLKVLFKRKVNPNLSMSRSTWNRINHFPLSPHRKFTAFMEIKFPTAVLRMEDETSMVFHIDVNSTTFSTILLTIRRDAFEMNLEDYVIARNVIISHFAER